MLFWRLDQAWAASQMPWWLQVGDRQQRCLLLACFALELSNPAQVPLCWRLKRTMACTAT